jgi:hypothetical protein
MLDAPKNLHAIVTLSASPARLFDSNTLSLPPMPPAPTFKSASIKSPEYYVFSFDFVTSSYYAPHPSSMSSAMIVRRETQHATKCKREREIFHTCVCPPDKYIQYTNYACRCPNPKP